MRRLILGLLFLTMPALAEDEPVRLGPAFDPSTLDMQAGMQRWQQTMQPGPHHELLGFLVGEWDTTTRMWLSGPDGQATESQGTAVNTLELDGRFVRSVGTGTMAGMPHEGMILLGFDRVANEYQMTSISSMSTAMTHAKGHASLDGRSIVLYGEMDEVFLGVYDREVRFVFTANDADTFTMEVHDLHIGIDGNRVVEVVFRRKTS